MSESLTHPTCHSSESKSLPVRPHHYSSLPWLTFGYKTGGVSEAVENNKSNLPRLWFYSFTWGKHNNVKMMQSRERVEEEDKICLVTEIFAHTAVGIISFASVSNNIQWYWKSEDAEPVRSLCSQSLSGLRYIDTVLASILAFTFIPCFLAQKGVGMPSWLLLWFLSCQHGTPKFPWMQSWVLQAEHSVNSWPGRIWWPSSIQCYSSANILILLGILFQYCQFTIH